MNAPRDIESRLQWMLDHPPGEPGMCARESWQALGGDQNPPNPPAWGTPNANAVYDNIVASGRYWTGGDIPRGAFIAWKYGQNGHAALGYGDGKIVTTDPTNDPGGTGVEPLSYPERWGASSSKRVYTDQYNGVRFAIGEPASVSHGPVYLSKLVYGQKDSDSVKRLQLHLNGHPLQGGHTLEISGNYLDGTDGEVRLCQSQHGFGNDPAEASSVGPKQAAHLFTGCACEVTDDLGTPEPPVVEPPPVTGGETVTFPLNIQYHFSGKPGGTFTFSGSKKKLDVASFVPKKDGLTLGMLYANVDGEGEFRTSLVREDPVDETAFQTHYAKGGDNYLLTHIWFESGEAGRGLHYQFESMDGTTHTVTTRYAKFVTIPWEVTIAMTAAVATVSAARTGAKRLASWLGVQPH